jgi:hypothetical protein
MILITSSFIFVSETGSNADVVTTITGANSNENFGYSVSTAGDFNGDGIEDIIIGAPGYKSNTGRSYLFFGGYCAGGNYSSDSANITFTGSTIGEEFGLSVSGGGDFNNDGFDDIVIGAPGNKSSRGTAYLFFGFKSLVSDIKAKSAETIIISAGADNRLGTSVSFVGDVNNDSFDDIALGAPGALSKMGSVHIVLGHNSSFDPLNSTDSDLTLTGQKEGDEFGYSVSGAGDFNNDGYSDVLVGAPGADKAFIYNGGDPMNSWVQTTSMDFEAASRKVHMNISAVDNGEARLDTFFGMKAQMAYYDRYSGSESTPVETPRTRTWDQATWSDRVNASVIGADDNKWFELESGTVRKNEKLLAVSDGGFDINVQVFDGVSKPVNLEIADVLPSTTTRAFDIAYESDSGDALIVYFNNSDPGSPKVIPRYRFWNGNSWSAEHSAEPLGGNTINWIVLSPDPRSDKILMTALDTNKYIYSQVWNGSEWGYPKLLETQASRTDMQCFDAVFESQSSYGMVVWGGNGGSNKNMNYRRWTAGWTEPAGTLIAGDGQINWVKIAADPNTNYIISSNLDNGKDIDVQIWNGSEWSTPEVEVTQDGERDQNRCFDVAWESTSRMEGLIVYGITTQEPRYRTISGTTVGSTELLVPDPNPDGDKPNWVVLESDPQTDDIILLWLEDDAGGPDDDISTALWTGSNWVKPQNISINSDRDNGQRLDVTYTDTSGYLISAPYNAELALPRGKIFWNADIYKGTSLKLRTHSSADSANWSTWSNWYSNGDQITDPLNKWIQFQAYFETERVLFSPVLSDVIIQLNRPDIIINGTPGDDFGLSVSGCGDKNDDGFDDIVIGAPRRMISRGSAYVIHGNNFASVTYLDSSSDSDTIITGESTGDLFGFSVSFAGDYNGDNFHDMLIGAPGHNGKGKIYIFYGNSTVKTTLAANEADLTELGKNLNDCFGWSVAYAGKIVNNSTDKLLVGIPYLDAPSNNGRIIILTNEAVINIGWIKTYDMNNNEGSSFTIGEQILIRTNITSLNCRDIIDNVTVTIRASDNSIILDNQSMQLEVLDKSKPASWAIYNYTFINPAISGAYTIEIILEDKFNDSTTGFFNYSLEPGPLYRIVITPDSANVVADNTKYFSAEGFDEYDNPVELMGTVWSTTTGGLISINPENATVRVGTSAGTGYINATVGSIIGSAVITVLQDTLFRIEVDPSDRDVTVNTQCSFSANGFDRFDNPAVMAGTIWSTDAGMIITYSDTTAEFRADTAVKTGSLTARIGSVVGTAQLDLLPDIIDRIEVTPGTAEARPGDAIKFSAKGYDEYGNEVQINPFWTSDIGVMNDSTLEVQKKAGIGYVNATNNGKTGSAEVTVLPDGLYQIMVIPSNTKVIAGDNESFKAIGLDIHGNVFDVDPDWSTNVGTMKGNTLTAQTNVGSGTVSATIGDITGFAYLTVIPDSLETIVVTPEDVEVIAGEEHTFSASGYDKYGNDVSISPIWYTDIGSMTDETLTAGTTVGTGSVTATYSGLIGATDVTVIPAELDYILVVPPNVIVNVGQVQKFSAVGYDKYNNQVNVTPDWSTDVGSLTGSLFTASAIPGKGHVYAHVVVQPDDRIMTGSADGYLTS